MQEVELRKGPWLEEEDEQLTAAVAAFGDRRWDALAGKSGLRRSGKSCRLRWMNYLRPNLKHGDISKEEERVIVELHEKWGNKWSRIARRLPGRTDNEIKNYWRSYLKKKSQVLDKECSSKTPGNTSTISEHGMDSPCSISGTGCFLFKDEDALRPFDDSSGGLEHSSFMRSPYEARLSEWVSNWNDDMSETGYKDEFFNFGTYSPEWISEDCTTSSWDYSLWDGL